MGVRKVLIANRSEIAVRIARAAAELGIRTVAIHSQDDDRSLHVRRCDEAVALEGRGPAAYLDIAAVIQAAKATGCDAIHPGYGFLSENATFARGCAEAGITFVGPTPEVLDLFGDKSRGRALATSCGVPVLRGTPHPVTLDEARAFMATLPAGSPVMVKAVAGGGGRGMRLVTDPDQLAESFERCRAEAERAFGRGDLIVEEALAPARHIEVQIVGDGVEVLHLHERECSVQRRHQKIVEIAPAPVLHPAVRERLLAAATRMAEEVHYSGLGTFEFLVDPAAATSGAARIAFIEANPRLQVEHTVTEEVTGVDLVQTQLRLAGGTRIDDLALRDAHNRLPVGMAVQLRINAERLDSDGTVRPSAGRIDAFEAPPGPGVRLDTAAYTGGEPNPAFDTLLAKLIVHHPAGTLAPLAARADRALRELRVDGIETNTGFLHGLLTHPAFVAGGVDTRFVDEHLATLLAGSDREPNRLHMPLEPRSDAAPSTLRAPDPAIPDGAVGVRSPLQGTIVSVTVAPGDAVQAGGQVLVMEAMKMHHVVTAPVGGYIRELLVQVGDTVMEGRPLVIMDEADVAADDTATSEEVDLDEIRSDLAEVIKRHAYGLDENRPDAVARRRRTGQRTTRENVEDLVDAGSFIEYGALALAPQRRRRPLQELIEKTPADGMVAGIGRVNGELFGDAGRCAVLSYDYTVLAGTQGGQNHRKKDRMFELAEKWKLPVVFFAEGGGGRPGDTDGMGGSGLDCLAFLYWGELSGLVPMVGITSGRCFAGNAAILGCCDVIIATEGSNIGMGGPAMIEGGGLGVFTPEEVGPLSVQVANGVVDVAVADEAEAVRVAKQYLSYFQGAVETWDCPDQRLLRRVIPENRLRVYDIRNVIDLLCDSGSVLELRRGWGHGMVTAFARIEGRPVGILANNPAHLGGAIDADASDKGARFLQLCDAFDIPVLTLCDTPGFMVGPEVETLALVRHACRLFNVGASITVPLMTVVLRKGYGLGAQAMAGGSFKAPMFTIGWPTSEYGGMGLEGAVRLGYRNELAAIEDEAERQRVYEEMVAKMYEHGKGISTASYFEIDDVIDPAETRTWISTALRSVPAPAPRAGKKRPCVDTW